MARQRRFSLRKRAPKVDQFRKLPESTVQPVVLLEGRRKVSKSNYKLAKRFGPVLAARFPRAVFRSGNADGSDQAFSEGVAAVDPSRLQLLHPSPHIVASVAIQMRCMTLRIAWHDSMKNRSSRQPSPRLLVTRISSPGFPSLNGSRIPKDPGTELCALARKCGRFGANSAFLAV